MEFNNQNVIAVITFLYNTSVSQWNRWSFSYLFSSSFFFFNINLWCIFLFRANCLHFIQGGNFSIDFFFVCYCMRNETKLDIQIFNERKSIQIMAKTSNFICKLVSVHANFFFFSTKYASMEALPSF